MYNRVLKYKLILIFLFIGILCYPADANEFDPVSADFPGEVADDYEEILLEEEYESQHPIKKNLFADIKSVNENRAVDLISPHGLQLEGSIVKSIKFGTIFDQSINFIDISGDNYATNYNVSAVDVFLDTHYADGKTTSRIMYNFVRDLNGYDNHFTEKISEFFVSHNLNDNQRFFAGISPRLPIGEEGAYSIMRLDFANRSQIARNYSNIRALGVRNQGMYKYASYDIGFYDSTRFLENPFEGSEFVGWVNFTPLADISEKTGNLTIGTGYNTGRRDYSYSVLGAYIGYTYKKLHLNFEYANANGHNGVYNNPAKSEGFYSSVLYDVHPKVQIGCRYDYFNPDKSMHSDTITEYTAGITYLLKRNLKVMLNYVFQNREASSDLSRLLILMRYSF